MHGGDVYFLRRQIYGYITVHLKAHKRLQFVDPRVGELQVSKEANIQRAKVKVQRDTQNGSHLRRED